MATRTWPPRSSGSVSRGRYLEESPSHLSQIPAHNNKRKTKLKHNCLPVEITHSLLVFLLIKLCGNLSHRKFSIYIEKSIVLLFIPKRSELHPMTSQWGCDVTIVGETACLTSSPFCNCCTQCTIANLLAELRYKKTFIYKVNQL